jgi:hypothetical protein
MTCLQAGFVVSHLRRRLSDFKADPMKRWMWDPSAHEVIPTCEGGVRSVVRLSGRWSRRLG